MLLTKLKFITSILYGKTNKVILFLSFLLLAGMVLEFIGLGVIFPLIISLVEPDDLFKYELIEKIYFQLSFTSKSQLTYLFLGIILFIYFLKTVFMVYLTYKQNNIISGFTSKLSHGLYRLYLSQPFKFYTKNNSSTLIKNIQIEVNYLSSYLMSVINILIDLTIIISLVLALILLEPKGTISFALYFLIIAFLYYQIVKPSLKKWGEKRGMLEKIMSKTLIEGLQSIKELILFRARLFYTKKFKTLNNEYAGIAAKNNTIQQIPRFFFELSAIIGILIFVFILVLKEDTSSNLLTTLGVFTAATFRIIPSLNRVIYSLQHIKFYTPSVDLIYKELNNFDLNVNLNLNDNKFNFKNDIKFQNVFFRYDQKTKYIFENLNFIIKKGDFIGIRGESGIGKSTLIDLLAGLFKPTHGEILVDGKNIFSNNSTTQNWMKNIGYVPQNILLIDDTIESNIILGVEPSAINKGLVNDVVEKSGLKKLIDSLPNGLNTFVGEKGVKLSGGQRQRIGIARALYKNPSILFFDEGTSALDDKTEKEVIKSITQLSRDKTIIMIAHKLSTLKYCHKVYEINQNKIKMEC